MALDVVLLNIAFILALVLGNDHALRRIVTDRFPFIAAEVLFFLCYSGLIIVVFEIKHLYTITVYLSGTLQIRLILNSLLYAMVGIMVLSFLAKSEIIVDSRLVLLLFMLLSMLFLVVGRVLVFRTLFHFCVRHDLFPRPILIVGAGSTGVKLAARLVGRNGLGLHVAGFLDDRAEMGTVVTHGVKVIGRIEEVQDVAARHRIEEIVICLEDDLDERYLHVVDLCAATRAWVLVGSEQFKAVPRLTYHETYGGVPVFTVARFTRHRLQPFLKALGDRILASLALVILLPVLVLVGIGIKLDSPGPVFYSHMRIGRNGKPFRFHKFRSMRTGSDRDGSREEKLRAFIREGKSEAVSSTKIVDKSKVTRMGRFIRKTSIDELPQLLNVIKGDMSLVGPRPCLPYEWNDYAEWHKRRLTVTPGCTGVWQVLGRSRVGFRDMVVLDLYYLYNMSFHLDAWLLLKTIPVMLFGKGGQ